MQEEHPSGAHSVVSNSSPAELNLLYMAGCLGHPALGSSQRSHMDWIFRCPYRDRGTSAQPGKGNVRLRVYPPVAKKARDPRELFVNLHSSNVLDKAPPEESALWAVANQPDL